MIYKCNKCGKSMHWDVNQNKLVCDCGSTEYTEFSNMSDATCDVCGYYIKDNLIAQLCENCKSNIINKSLENDIAGISLPKMDKTSAIDSIMLFINRLSFHKKIHKATAQLLYLPYDVISGEIVYDNNEKQAISDVCVYTGEDKDKKLRSRWQFETNDVVEFDDRYLCGSFAYSRDKRREVIEMAKSAKIQVIADGKTCTDFNETQDFYVLFPVYHIRINDKYDYYLNGTTNEIEGTRYRSLISVIKYEILKYTALLIILISSLFVFGGAFRL